MSRDIHCTTREFLRIRLQYARNIHRKHLAYQTGVFRKMKKFPRVTIMFYFNRFYMDVKPFYTTRYENER